MYYNLNISELNKKYYMVLTNRNIKREEWYKMKYEEVLKQDNVKVVNTRELTVQDKIDNLVITAKDKYVKKLGKEYVKLTLTIEKYFSLIELYGCTTFDKNIFVKLYEQWLDNYLKCCAKGLHKYYLSEEIQDFYHTCKTDLKEFNYTDTDKF